MASFMAARVPQIPHLPGPWVLYLSHRNCPWHLGRDHVPGEARFLLTEGEPKAQSIREPADKEGLGRCVSWVLGVSCHSRRL